MNIYHICWTQSGYGLNAVVIASDEADALRTLDLDHKYHSDIRVLQMGTCTNGTADAIIVCEESL